MPLRGGELQAIVGRALALGKGSLRVIDDRGESWILSEKLTCRRCSRGFEPLDPRLFSFNSRYGACTRCEGLGVVDEAVCPVCNGKRLREEALAVRVKGKGIAELTELSVSQAEETIKSFDIRAQRSARGRGDRGGASAAVSIPVTGGARLPDARSQRRYPLRRRGPAHPVGRPAGLEPHGDLLYPRRAHDRPSPEGQRHADLDASGPAGARQFGDRRRARRGDDPRERLDRRPRTRRRAFGWPCCRPGNTRRSQAQPRVGDGRLGERSPEGDHLPAAPCRRAHPAYGHGGEEKQSEAHRCRLSPGDTHLCHGRERLREVNPGEGGPLRGAQGEALEEWAAARRL